MFSVIIDTQTSQASSKSSSGHFEYVNRVPVSTTPPSKANHASVVRSLASLTLKDLPLLPSLSCDILPKLAGGSEAEHQSGHSFQHAAWAFRIVSSSSSSTFAGETPCCESPAGWQEASSLQQLAFVENCACTDTSQAPFRQHCGFIPFAYKPNQRSGAK